MKRPLRRGIWFVVALVISTSVYFTIRYGLRPKPIPVMNPTQFENPQQIGAVTYKRLRQEIRAERLLVIGSAVDWPDSTQVWLGFLKSALAENMTIDILLIHEGLPAPEGLSIPVEFFSEAAVQSGELARKVDEHLQAGHQILVIGATAGVTHLMPNSLSRSLEMVAHHPLLSFSLIALSLNPEEIQNLQSECLQKNSDFEGVAHLHCSEARVSKNLLKKRPGADQTWSVIERHGLKEYLIFVKPPKSAVD